ncbi:MAG: branched-chain amino acid ABC transporter permease, partial [Bacillota bacterium]|nr:branched-chain amino acid ABC transporter permease [Bacillota bacterium]
ERRAQALGYDTFRYKLLAMLAAGLLAAVAGALQVLFFRYVSPQVLALDNTISVILMVIIGGSGTLAGPVLGSVVVTALGTLLSSYTQHWLLIFGLLYVAIVLWRPQGILGGSRGARGGKP